MKKPPRSKPSNPTIGFITGLIVGPLALIVVVYFLTAKSTETATILGLTVVFSPVVGVIVGGFCALVGWLMRKENPLSALLTCLVLALLTPFGVYSFFNLSNSIQTAKYRQLSMKKADQVHRMISADFPQISGLIPESEAASNESLGPGVGYRSTVPYDQLLSEVKSKTGSDWDGIELTDLALFACSKPPAGVSLITLRRDFSGRHPSALFRRTGPRGVLYAVAEAFRNRLLEGVRNDPKALQDAFKMLTPDFQSKLGRPESLKALLPKERTGKLSGTNFGAESIQMETATMDMQIGEIRTKTQNGETIEWVMAETKFEQSKGLWRVSGFTLKPPNMAEVSRTAW